MRELRLVEIFGKWNISVYSELDTYKELRKLLNKAWDARCGSFRFIWYSNPNAKRSARYRDVSKIIEEAKATFMYDKPEGICNGLYTDSEGHLRKTRRIRRERRGVDMSTNSGRRTLKDRRKNQRE